MHQASKGLTDRLERILDQMQDQSREVVDILGDILSVNQEMHCQLADANGHLGSLAEQLDSMLKCREALTPYSSAAPAASPPDQSRVMKENSSLNSSSSDNKSTTSSSSQRSSKTNHQLKSQGAPSKGKVHCHEGAISLSLDRELQEQLATLGHRSTATSHPAQKLAIRWQGKTTASVIGLGGRV